jgi:hypothetical protein
MNRKAQVIVAWVCAASLAILFQPKITIFDFPLNLTVVLVYAFAIMAPPLQSASTSFTDVSAEIRGSSFGAAIGLIEDAMSGTIPGLNVLSKGLIGFISSIIFRDFFSQWTPVIGGIVIFMLTILDGAIVMLTGEFIAGINMGGSSAIQMIFMQAIVNFALGCLIKSGQKIASMKYL